MDRLWMVIFVLFVFGFFTSLATAGPPEFSEGQVWAYKTRPGEENSTLLIDKIESDPNPKIGTIYHISVTGVRVKSPRGVTSELPHLPVSQVTLEKSVTKMLRKSQPNVNYLAGYTEWKKYYDMGKAGVFALSVAEVIDTIEEGLNKALNK